MGYTTKEGMVRVDFFRPSGKWYTTEAICMVDGYNDLPIHVAFKQALQRTLKGRLNEMDAICLEPYHQHEHPIQLKAGHQD